MARGKRQVIFEFKRSKFIPKQLEEDTYKRLKEQHGVKYSDKISMYVALEQEKIYCVINDSETIVLDI